MERGSIVPQMRAELKMAPATSARYSSLHVQSKIHADPAEPGASLKVNEELGSED